MTALDDPHILAHQLAHGGRRTKCPRCGARLTREPIPGRPGFDRLYVACAGLDCTWSQQVDVPNASGGGGDAELVELPPPDHGRDDWSAPTPELQHQRRKRGQQDHKPTHPQTFVRQSPRPPEGEPPEGEPPEVSEEAADTDEANAADPELPGAVSTEAAVMPEQAKPATHAKVCRVPVCDLKAKARGMCNAHNARWHNAGKPEPIDDWARDQTPIKKRGTKKRTAAAEAQQPAERAPVSTLSADELTAEAGDAPEPECQDDNDTATSEAPPSPAPAPASATEDNGERATAGGSGRTTSGGGASGGGPVTAEFLRVYPLPAGTTAITIGMIGDYVTIATVGGYVLQQMPLKDVEQPA